MRLAAIVVVWLVAILAAGHDAQAQASVELAARDAAIAKARALGLAKARGWRRLLLFADGAGSSQIDGDEAFLSPHGRDDPEAELVATLVALHAPVVEGREDAHALCRFPARAMFLDAALHFERNLARRPRRCPARERFEAGADAESISLVYAANDVASPPSAFGHILLRVRSRRAAHPTDDTDASDLGVDYTATTDTRSPIVYAFKGIAGMFAGRFRVSAYDTMLREYATIAARDVWEYELALRDDEVRLFLAHLWELTNAPIDYGYTGENCAYRLVAAIDAAAPRLRLVESLGPIVMPVDVVRAVSQTRGLVRSAAYRPSVRSAARIAVARLDDDEQALLDRLLDEPGAPLPEHMTGRRAIDVLDAAMRVLEARRTRGMLEGDDREALALKDRLSARRDAVAIADAGARGYVTPPPDAEGLDPRRAHGPMRVTIGSGAASQHGTGFGEVGARLALHDLADPPAGEPDLTQVQLLDVHLRYDWGVRELTLDSLTFADLMTLAPLTRFDERPSWRARAFGTRLHDDGCLDCFSHGLDGSVGLATGTDDASVVAFLMADAYVALAADLDGIDHGFVRAGLGPFAGGRARLGMSSVALVTGTWSWLPGQDPEQTFDIRGSFRTGLATDVAMGIEASAQPRSVEARVATYVYF